MIGPIFQAWFILSINLYMYFNDTQPILVKELSVSALAFCFLFFIWQKKKIKDIESYFFILSSVSLILYTSLTGMFFLPDSMITQQKLYIRFIFYLSILVFFFLYKIGTSKKLLIFYTVIASSYIYIYRHHYSSIAIFFYLISNLYLLRKFSISKKNIFDILVFLLFTSSILSTYNSFYYNGTNAIFGFFHLLSGILLYLFLKYIEEEELLKVIRYNHFYYGISLILYTIFIIVYFYSHNFNPDFSLSIGGFHVSNIGSMIAVNFPSVLACYLLWTDKHKWVYFIVLILSMLVLYFTQSIASIFGVTISSIFIATYYYKSPTETKSKLLPILLLLIAFISIFIGGKLLQSEVFSVNSSVARTAIWITYLERVTHHSILFGFGANNEYFNSFLPIDYLSENTISDLKYYFINFQANPHAHNLYIQFIYNYGIYGFSILTGILFSAFFLLAKKIINHDFRFIEIVGFSILSSIFFQEMFDYTMLDAMTYFPTAFALGIISRYSSSFNLFHSKKNYYQVSLKAIYAIQFFICLFISMLGFNLGVSENIKILFKNEFTIDNFSNLKFSENLVLTEEKLKNFRKLDSLYLPINLDDKKEQFAGQVYLEAYKISKEKRDLDIAEKNFSKCIMIFPNSAVCYKKLYEIEMLKSNIDAANNYYEKYKNNDPFGLVN